MGADQWQRNLSRRPRNPSHTIWSWVIVFVMFAFVLMFSTRIILSSINRTDPLVERTFYEREVAFDEDWLNVLHRDILDIDTKLAAKQASLLAFEGSSGPRETWDFSDRFESSRLHADVEELESQRRILVADYNIRARRTNRDLFERRSVPTDVSQRGEE